MNQDRYKQTIAVDDEQHSSISENSQKESLPPILFQVKQEKKTSANEPSSSHQLYFTPEKEHLGRQASSKDE